MCYELFIELRALDVALKALLKASLEAATEDPFVHRTTPQYVGDVSNLADVADATETVVAVVSGTTNDSV